MERSYEEELRSLTSFVSDKVSVYKHCLSEIKKEESAKSEAEENTRIYAEATQWLRDLYEQTQERYHGQIMQIVSYCLKEVFGEDAYSFKVVFEQKRNQVETSLWFERDGELFDPLQASGGGVLSVACFALRLAVLYLTQQATRLVMVLDEPFGQLSVEYRERMASLITELSERFGFQFILITHASEFELGKVYRIDSDHKLTVVQEYERDLYGTDI